MSQASSSWILQIPGIASELICYHMFPSSLPSEYGNSIRSLKSHEFQSMPIDSLSSYPRQATQMFCSQVLVVKFQLDGQSISVNIQFDKQSLPVNAYSRLARIPCATTRSWVPFIATWNYAVECDIYPNPCGSESALFVSLKLWSASTLFLFVAHYAGDQRTCSFGLWLREQQMHSEIYGKPIHLNRIGCTWCGQLALSLRITFIAVFADATTANTSGVVATAHSVTRILEIQNMSSKSLYELRKYSWLQTCSRHEDMGSRKKPCLQSYLRSLAERWNFLLLFRRK